MTAIVMVNMVIVVGFLYLSALFIGKFNSMEFLEFKFQYSALRNRLATLANSGELDKSSSEYQYISEALKHHIQAIETMSIVQITHRLSVYYTSRQAQKFFRIYGERITNEKVIEVIVAYLEITRKLLLNNSRAQLAVLRCASKIGMPTSKRIKSKRKDVFRQQSNIKLKEAIDKLRTQITELTSKLHSVPV